MFDTLSVSQNAKQHAVETQGQTSVLCIYFLFEMLAAQVFTLPVGLLTHPICDLEASTKPNSRPKLASHVNKKGEGNMNLRQQKAGAF